MTNQTTKKGTKRWKVSSWCCSKLLNKFQCFIIKGSTWNILENVHKCFHVFHIPGLWMFHLVLFLEIFKSQITNFDEFGVLKFCEIVECKIFINQCFFMIENNLCEWLVCNFNRCFYVFNCSISYIWSVIEGVSDFKAFWIDDFDLVNCFINGLFSLAFFNFHSLDISNHHGFSVFKRIFNAIQ